MDVPASSATARIRIPTFRSPPHTNFPASSSQAAARSGTSAGPADANERAPLTRAEERAARLKVSSNNAWASLSVLADSGPKELSHLLGRREQPPPETTTATASSTSVSASASSAGAEGTKTAANSVGRRGNEGTGEPSRRPRQRREEGEEVREATVPRPDPTKTGAESAQNAPPVPGGAVVATVEKATGPARKGRAAPRAALMMQSTMPAATAAPPPAVASEPVATGPSADALPPPPPTTHRGRAPLRRGEPSAVAAQPEANCATEPKRSRSPDTESVATPTKTESETKDAKRTKRPRVRAERTELRSPSPEVLPSGPRTIRPGHVKAVDPVDTAKQAKAEEGLAKKRSRAAATKSIASETGPAKRLRHEPRPEVDPAGEAGSPDRSARSPKRLRTKTTTSRRCSPAPHAANEADEEAVVKIRIKTERCEGHDRSEPLNAFDVLAGGCKRLVERATAQERDPTKITAIRDLSTRLQSSFLQRAMLLSSIARATARLGEVQTRITAARTRVG